MWAPLITEWFGVEAETLEACSEETQTGGTVCFLALFVQELHLTEPGVRRGGDRRSRASTLSGRAAGLSGVQSA